MTQLALQLDPPAEADISPPTFGENECWVPGVDVPVKMPQSHASYPERAKGLKKIIDEVWELTRDRRAYPKILRMWDITLRRHEPGDRDEGTHREAREEEYLEIADDLGEEATHLAAKGFALVRTHFIDDGAFFDLLGATYELLADDWGGQVLGQYFTPWPLARMKARMTMTDVGQRIEADEPVDLHDPTGGSGVLLLAAMSVVAEEHGRRALRMVRPTAVDIDPICCRMARIQLRMVNIPWFLSLMAATCAEMKTEKEVS